MGKLCSKEVQAVPPSDSIDVIEPLIPQEKEVKIPSYSSEADKYYEKQEKKFNYLTKIPFKDYLYSLVNFSNENATLDDDYSKTNLDYSANDAFFEESFFSDTFQSFIENKILKHKAIYDDVQNNEKMVTIFKNILVEGHNALGQKLSQDSEKKGNPVDKNSIIKKGNALAFGLLFCGGPNYAKVRAIFNLFQEGGNLKTNEKFNDFMLSVFTLASYGMLHVRNKISDYEEVGGIEKSIIIKLKDTCELKDSQHLVEVTNKLIFGEDLSLSLNYEEFKAKFADENKDTSIGFMLTPPGVRFMQNKHNV